MATSFSQAAIASETASTICTAQKQAQKLQEILQPATPEQPSVYIDCSLNIPKNAKISKQLIFAGEQASHIVFDGNGAQIQATYAKPSVLITSQQQANQHQTNQHQTNQHESVWQVPHHITIKNAQIIGSLRIHGMAANGEGEYLRNSSHEAGHTERAQQAAPHHIILDNLTLIGGEHNMMYFAPGVQYVSLKNSHFEGKTDGLALYLDAESGHHVIENNVFQIQTKSRELLAIDGSAYNQIRHNQFIEPRHGAIYLYRNCGEGGTVRHQTASYNQLTDNRFVITRRSKWPLIWIGSRNGRRSYCDADQGYQFGSSLNDADLAQHNVVSGNQFMLKKMTGLAWWMRGIKRQLIRVDVQPNQVGTNPLIH